MADGFKIAEGFVEVTAEDNTRTGLSRISAVIERWAAAADRKVKVDVDVDVDKLSRTDTMLGRVTASLGQFADRAKDAVIGATKVGATVATLASLAGPATLAVLGLADGISAVASGAAAMAPALALAPSVIGGWQFLKFTLTGIGEQMGETLKPLGEAFEAAQVKAGRLASQGLPALAAAFREINFPNIVDAMGRIGERTNLVVGIFGNWVNSTPGIKLIKDTTDGVAAAFERAAVPITAAAISLGNMANRADVVDRLTAIGDAIGRAADRFNAWTDRVTSADIDGAFRRVGDAAQFVVDKVRAVRDIIEWLADHQSAIRGVSDAFAGIGIVLGVATGGWVAVVAGAVTLILNHFDRVVPVVQAMASKVVDAFNAIANDPWVQKIAADIREIAGLIRDDFAAGIAWLGDRWAELKPKVAEAWAVLGPVIDGFLKDETVRTGLRFWADTLGIVAAGFIGLSAAAGILSATLPAVLGGFVAWLTGTFVNGVIAGFQAVVSFIQSIPGAVSAAWSAVTGAVSSAVTAVIGFFEQIPARLAAVWQAVMAAASSAWQTVVATVAAVPGQVLGFIGQMAAQVPYLVGYMVGQVVGFFIQLAAGTIGAIAALPGQVAALFTQARDQAVALATAMVSTVVSTAQTLPGRVMSAITGLVSTVTSVFTQARDQAVTTTTSLVSQVVAAAAALPGRVAAAISSLASQVAAQFNSARTQAVSVMTGLVSQVVSIVAGLPGKAAAAIGNIGGVLAGAGRQLIQGFIDGVRSMIPSLDGVLGSITSRIPQVKGPPEKDARLLEPSGRLIMGGLIRGIDAGRPALEQHLSDLTGVIGGLGTSLAAGQAIGGTSYHFAPGSVTLDASKIRDLRDLLDMLDGVRSTARQYGAVPIGA